MGKQERITARGNGRLKAWASIDEANISRPFHGLRTCLLENPALKCWAIVIRPLSRTGSQRRMVESLICTLVSIREILLQRFHRSRCRVLASVAGRWPFRFATV